MKITFITPNLNLTGGLRVVAIYAKLLTERGHLVTIVSSRKSVFGFWQKAKFLLKGKKYSHKPTFDDTFFKNAPFQIKVLDSNRAVNQSDVPDADIIISTFWSTAEWIAEFPPSKGEKVYFIQHYEIHPWLPIERVKETLSLPYKKITVAQWITNILKDEYQCDSIVVPNGVDINQFYSLKRNKQLVPTFGIMYSSRGYKGCDIALVAFNKAKAIIPELKLIGFGTDSMPLPWPEGTEYYLKPEQDKLKDIYSKCDAWLFSSRSEGFGLPILEAMACRTPVIGTSCGAAPQLICHQNGSLIEIDNIEQMSDAIIKFATMANEQWLSVSESAYQTALTYRWEDSCNKFEKALLNLVDNN